MNPKYAEQAQALSELLSLSNPPLAITFSNKPLANVPAFDEPMPDPTEDGRTGRVPAGCVFWIKAEQCAFTTTAEDHGNCSVGSVTHGFKTLEEVANKSDIAFVAEKIGSKRRYSALSPAKSHTNPGIFRLQGSERKGYRNLSQ